MYSTPGIWHIQKECISFINKVLNFKSSVYYIPPSWGHIMFSEIFEKAFCYLRSLLIELKSVKSALIADGLWECTG